MDPQKRIIINTAAQYGRTIINVCLSLYSTRLILSALGQSDYGIYSLIAGVVAMLSFVTNALVITTQRFLSYSRDQFDAEKSRMVFGNSLLIHIGIGLALMMILLAIMNPAIAHLNIDSSRIDAARWVFVVVVVMMALSFWIAPFRATFIAHENIVYISIVDVLDGVLKLCLAIWLTYMMDVDRLIVYALIMLGIMGFNLLVFSIGGFVKFKECHWPRLKEWDSSFMKEMAGFAGWTTYSMGCVLLRTQGFSVVLNHFFGTIVNAAYGVAQQVFGAINFIAQSVVNAMSPQIVSQEGQGNREQMICMSESLSKFATMLIAVAVIPIIAEMPSLLKLWLGQVPPYSVLLCRCILLAAMIDQLTCGLNVANQAVGKIRKFSLWVNTTKLLTLPIAYIGLVMGLPMQFAVTCFVGIEFLCAMIRIPLLKESAHISIKHYIKSVFIPVIEVLVIPIVFAWGLISFVNMEGRMWLSIPLIAIVCLICVYVLGLTQSEKEYMKILLKIK